MYDGFGALQETTAGWFQFHPDHTESWLRTADDPKKFLSGAHRDRVCKEAKVLVAELGMLWEDPEKAPLIQSGEHPMIRRSSLETEQAANATI